MRTDFRQDGAFMQVSTPFGADVLLLDAMEASEGLSELSSLTLDMRSADTALDASRIIGQPVTVTLQVGEGPKRHFNGIVVRFVHTGGDREFSHYRAEVAPRLWLLTLSRDRAIWQNQSAAEIVKAVLGRFGVGFDDRLSGSYGAIEYCVQHDETAFDFISRLMEAVGIFYFFSSSDGDHQMVLADAAGAHVDCPDGAAVRFLPATGPRQPTDTITSFELEHRLVLQKHTLSDFDPLQPGTALKTEASGTLGKGEVFEWPAGHLTVSAGTALAKLRVQASQVDSQVLRGDGHVYPFAAGTRFTLSGHFRSTLNTTHVLRRVRHTVRDGGYRNHFEAFAASLPFRAPLDTPRPRVLGSQTATVVGPSGEEIWCDQHGRIKVQFHWDRLGRNDENSSCWVRVMQASAGAGFGTLNLPRIGQEVVITHVDGDPDRPLVTGCVYNGTHATPVTLPAHQTQTVLRTRSSKQGTAGNEIRLEDKKDSEEFYLHAQKDMKVEIENDLSVTLTEGSETRTLEKGDRTIEVRTGKEVHSVKGTRELTVTGDETRANEAGFKHTVSGDYTLTVDGDLVLDIGGTILIKSAKSITVQSGTTLTHKAGSSLSNEAATALSNEAGTALTNKAGTSLTNQAGTSLTNKASLGLVNQAGTTLDNKGAMINNKASAMQTVDGGGMLTLKGGLVKIN
ncbi:type VI secretion system secreted protein VgrG [Sphaerotilus hippei]|uniref:Type VI secretion system secreted protein VgrG n=1 Tax=Sphaerotilus hippei TaxID=744406 RepID=A0A318H2L2_9BURK|nr:type VI secretion system tip protein TssI/VgrG [Sphaerotilus hippei]PXW97477.1 type VI secretion system secreted protein VgrG [Sphaerotilus hippei]